MSPVRKVGVRDVINKVPLTSLQQWAHEIDVVQVTTPHHCLEVWSPLASTQNLPLNAQMFTFSKNVQLKAFFVFFFFVDLGMSDHVFSVGEPISAPLGNRDVEIGAICRF